LRASDLHLLELLELLPDEGRIQLETRRMLLWDADAFGDLRRELIETIGLVQARPILRRFGFASGYRDAVMTRELFSWDNDTEWWLSCAALQRHEGKFRATPERLVVDRATGSFEMEVTWEDSYEAAQHQRVFGPAGEPVCWTLAGFASGFSTALMGEEVYVVEVECTAMGGDRCRVVGKTRRAWGDQGAEHASEYEARPLTAELEAREAELRRQRKNLRRRERELARLGPTNVTTRSRQMERVLDLAQIVSRVDSTVLISGESGTGKERIARLIHEESPRADGPFIAINCGALPEALLERELFGAGNDKKGLFEAAAGGTLFLDEIGATSPATQARLLRVLEEREVLSIGATEPAPIDVRVVAATNRDLAQMVEAGELREDLLYRLRVVSVELPPLRDRREDILPLARELARSSCAGFAVAPKTLSPEAAGALMDHRWPGNVRELENAIERAVVLSGERGMIGRDDLPPEVRGATARADGLQFDEVVPIAELEKRYVLEVLRRFDGNRTHTAKALGIGANTLWRKLKAWGVPPARNGGSR
jgi:DNA-binding NtrC family response regulator